MSVNDAPTEVVNQEKELEAQTEDLTNKQRLFVQELPTDWCGEGNELTLRSQSFSRDFGVRFSRATVQLSVRDGGCFAALVKELRDQTGAGRLDWELLDGY